MYKCEREMHEHMDAAQRRIDSESEEDETRLGTRNLNNLRSKSLAAALAQPDTEAPLESWMEFISGSKTTPLSPLEKTAQVITSFAFGEAEFQEFLKPDPTLSPSQPQLA